MKKNKLYIIGGFLVIIVLLVGNTHRFLPSESDPCQSDITHKDHVNELAMFHCIGHTEYEVDYEKKGLSRVKKWDHIHPWMTLEWHLEQGFTKEQAITLLQK